MNLLKTLLVTFVVFIAVPSFAAEWVQLKDIDVFYDKSKIINDKKTGDILVWEKYTLPDSAIKESQGNFKLGKSKIDYSNYSHNIMQLRLNCRDNTLTTISGAEYNKSGEILYSWDNNIDLQKKYKTVVKPKSIGESLLKDVCKNIADNKMIKKKNRK